MLACAVAKHAAATRQKRRRVAAAKRPLASRVTKLGRQGAPSCPPGSPRWYASGEVGCHPLVQLMGLEQMQLFPLGCKRLDTDVDRGQDDALYPLLVLALPLFDGRPLVGHCCPAAAGHRRWCILEPPARRGWLLGGEVLALLFLLP